MKDMADALSALSLMLAAISVFVGMWHPVAMAVLATKVPGRISDAGPERAAVAGIATQYAMLTVASLAVALIFLPRAWAVTLHALTTGGTFDDLRCAFVAAEFLVCLLAGLLVATMIRLGARRRTLGT